MEQIKGRAGTEFRCLLLALACLPLLHAIPARASGSTPLSAQAGPRLEKAFGAIPLHFEPNRGQSDPRVEYLARGRGFGLYLTRRGATLVLSAPTGESARGSRRPPRDTRPHVRSTIRISLEGGNAAPALVGLDRLAGTSSYFLGNDPSRWIRAIPTFGRVACKQVYPGVDVVYYGAGRALEYDFQLAAGTNPRTIRLRYDDGAGNPVPLRVSPSGDLLLSTPFGRLVQHAPAVFQMRNGEKNMLSGHYEILGPGRVGLVVASYDASRPLTIDPILSYSTYLGGSGQDQAAGIAVDSNGNAYVTGSTQSTDFPQASDAPSGGWDAFVTKFSPDGKSLLYSIYFGGKGDDLAHAIAVDSSGDVTIAGQTTSYDLPVLKAFQPTHAGTASSANEDAFIAEFGPSGTALLYSSYLGGFGDDVATAVALDAAGDAFVTGYTYSPDFPASSNADQPAYGGAGDGFLSEVAAGGNKLLYSSFLGGEAYDEGRGIAVSTDGHVFVTGDTSSVAFPILNAYQAQLAGASDAFVSAFDFSGATGTSPGQVIYSTYLGGAGSDAGLAVAADASGDAYVTGYTYSTHFPTSPGAYQRALTAGQSADAFVTEFSPTGGSLVYSTYLGGSAFDAAYAIALASDGSACVAGDTYSTDFPVAFPVQAANASASAGNSDTFVSKLSPSGSALSFSTYLGGSDTDQGRAIALDSSNNIYVAGTTYSSNFPMQNAFQSVSHGAGDAFVSKILLAGCTLTCTAVASPGTGAAPLPVTFSATATPSSCGSGTVAYDWNFGDGTPHASAPNTSHTYLQPGSYTWTLTVSLDGTTCTQSGSIVVTPGCTVSCSANATPTAGPAPLAVALTASASSSDCGGAATYLWNFGDGSAASTAQNPSHTYLQPGTYTWAVTATIAGSTCTQSGSVTALATPGSLSGMVAISAGDQFFSLDGPGIVSGTVTAVDSAGNATTAPLSGGHFSFSGLAQGSYQLTATVTYTDNVLYDADLLSYGCTAPSGMQIQKTAISAPVAVDTSNTAYVVVSFPPPLVMIHGMFDCYQKWYDPNASDSNAALYWDNDARAHGLISFTPNYAWWGGISSWPTMADEVAQQIGQDLSGLSSSGAGTGSAVPPIPTVWIAHDMGGLVARVLASGDHRNDVLVQNVWKIYLLGVPNSGTNLQLAGSDNGTLSTDTILRRFNAVYPDFGSLQGRVYAIAGDSGLWGLQNDDGLVSLASAFTISRELCTTTFGYPVCQQYPAVSFAAGTGHIFGYSHADLGGPASAKAILEGVILPGVAALAKSGPLPEHVPESPAGTTVWGTTSRTSGTKRGRIKATLSRSEAGQSFSYPFTIGETDGMALLATVTDGSAAFQLLDPTGQVAQSSPSVDGLFSFSTLNPAPGAWTLVVTPGGSGVSFTATAQEDSPFGIRGSLDESAYLPNSTAVLRVDLEGSLKVVPASVTASIYDGYDNLIETVPLYDDGQHDDGAPGDGAYGALLAAFTSPGSYPVVFTATGSYQGEAFSRLAFATLTVVPSTHLLTGAFALSPVSQSGGGPTDAIQMTAGVNLPAAGSYALSADLLDAGGLFVAHASTALTATAAGLTTATLVFPLDGATCSQLDAPLTVAGLQVLDGTTLTPEDVWGSPIYTPAYPSGTFSCQSGTPEPTPTALQPSQAVTGTSISLLVAGTGFQGGATLTFDSGIQVNKVIELSQNLLSASVTVLSNAAAGGHTLTVTNPNGTSGNLVSALTVTPNQPPAVTLLTPASGTSYFSSSPTQVSVSASASDDIGVTQVVFLLDGAPEASVSQFPFIWSFPSSVLTHGAHTLTAVAYDTSGLTAQASVTIYKDPPTVTAISKLINPFRLKVTGTNFLPGLSVTIGSDTTPWPGVTVKSDTKLILKKGARLKALFPKGQAVSIRIAYPDGTQGTASYTRP
ncbi:MAG: SBBP repeat-containing protein [Acidobacteriota bacterium]